MRPYRLTPLAPREHDLQGSILVYLAWDHRVAGGLALLARGLPGVQAGLDHFLGGRGSWVGTYPLPADPVAGGEGVRSPSARFCRPRGPGGGMGSGSGR